MSSLMPSPDYPLIHLSTPYPTPNPLGSTTWFLPTKPTKTSINGLVKLVINLIGHYKTLVFFINHDSLYTHNLLSSQPSLLNTIPLH